MELSPISTQTDTASPLAEREASSDEMSQFLRLLTAQIENQDPLEPLDANQFIEQLATINALEQQIATNGKLDDIIQLLSGA